MPVRRGGGNCCDWFIVWLRPGSSVRRMRQTELLYLGEGRLRKKAGRRHGSVDAPRSTGRRETERGVSVRKKESRVDGRDGRLAVVGHKSPKSRVAEDRKRKRKRKTRDGDSNLLLTETQRIRYRESGTGSKKIDKHKQILAPMSAAATSSGGCKNGSRKQARTRQ